MRVELLAICDAATDCQGRLNILGVFEGIAAPKLPVLRDRCSIVTRMRFACDEAGAHQLRIALRNKKGVLLVPELKARFNVKRPAGNGSVAANLVLNLNKLKIEEFGCHEIALFIDDKMVESIPLIVARAMKKQVRGTMDN